LLEARLLELRAAKRAKRKVIAAARTRGVAGE
jgi:hypothetical protein